MGIEEDLSEVLKHLSFGRGKNLNEILLSMTKAMQVKLLEKLRSDVDAMIKGLQPEAPASSSVPDPFSVLGIDPTATEEETKEAYRKKAAEHHPDRGGTDQEMMLVNASYEAIRRVRGWK